MADTTNPALQTVKPQAGEVLTGGDAAWQMEMAHRQLDRMGIPRADDECYLSAWGRFSLAFQQIAGLRITIPLTGPARFDAVAAPAQAAIDAREPMKLGSDGYLNDRALIRLWDSMPDEDVGPWERAHAFVLQVREAEAKLASLDAAPAPAEDGGVTDERAAFEADYMRRFNKPGYLGPDGAGGYGHSLTQARWEGWCSRAALALAQPAPVPYAWAVSGIGTPFYGDFAEQDAHSVARHVGGNAYAFPLYRAAPVQQEAAGDAINDIIRDASESEAPDMCDTSAITIRVDDLRVLLERHLCIVGDEGRAA
ncbi:hypothetical protein ACEN9J_02770 [Variovorax sp. Varisp41]|uniref:hypothetical protein n=1 Tax=Variovorax sp. Varisp41 TaxID=3243033 RepID=UPI0039B6348B